MSDTVDSTSTQSYELTCPDCDYEATVTGTVHDALDMADAHQDEHGSFPMDHFVTFQLEGYEQ